MPGSGFTGSVRLPISSHRYVAGKAARCMHSHAPATRRHSVFALSLGAVWTGGLDESPPVMLDAAIIFAAVGELVPAALKAVRKGGQGSSVRHLYE